MSTTNHSEYEINLQRVSNDLKLIPENQDWGIINANHSRVEEFIDYFTYNINGLSGYIVCDIIDLIFSSYNELLLDNIHNFLLEKRFLDFIYWLKKEKHCEDAVYYWRKLDHNSEFPVSKLLA